MWSDALPTRPRMRVIICKKTSSQQNQQFLINGIPTRAEKNLIADIFNEYFPTIGIELTKDVLTIIVKHLIIDLMEQG